MPAQTPNRGYRIPTGSDRPLGAVQMLQLADDIDADVATLKQLLDAATANRTERSMSRTANIGVADSTVTDVSVWGATLSNTGDLGYTSGNSFWTVGTAGSYLWGCTVMWPSTSGAHSRQQFLRVNGAEPAMQNGHSTWEFSGFQAAVPLSTVGKLQLAKGDQVTLAIYHNFGSSLSLPGAQLWLARNGG